MSVDKTVKISDRVTGRYVATFGCSQSVYCLKFSAADLCGTTGGCVGRSSIMAIFHVWARRGQDVHMLVFAIAGRICHLSLLLLHKPPPASLLAIKKYKAPITS